MKSKGQETKGEGGQIFCDDGDEKTVAYRNNADETNKGNITESEIKETLGRGEYKRGSVTFGSAPSQNNSEYIEIRNSFMETFTATGYLATEIIRINDNHIFGKKNSVAV